MRATQAPAADGITRPSSRTGWVAAASVLLGAGWGAQQFSPMLLVYHQVLGLGTGTLEAMFGVYALGLIPALLLAGPASDARGRRALVVPAAGLSLLASVLLILAGHDVALLFAGRLLAGISSGIAFGTGTAWLRELSRPPWGGASDLVTARRAVVAMTTGFALGPLVAGLLAEWAPAPTVVPYLPHVVLMAVVLVLLRKTPETVTGRTRQAPRLAPPGLGSARFRRVVAPMAPWVFAAPAVAFALLPSIVGAGHATEGIALSATVAGLCALSGVAVQPLARRLDAAGPGNRAATTGLLVLAAGLALSAVTAQERLVWLLIPCAIVLGSAYGLCLVAGLVEVQRLAGDGGLASLTAIYYTLAYVGFAVPNLIVLGTQLASYAVLLAIAAALALGTRVVVARG
jgi:Major Facilitator Superfamily